MWLLFLLLGCVLEAAARRVSPVVIAVQPLAPPGCSNSSALPHVCATLADAVALANAQPVALPDPTITLAGTHSLNGEALALEVPMTLAAAAAAGGATLDAAHSATGAMLHVKAAGVTLRPRSFGAMVRGISLGAGDMSDDDWGSIRSAFLEHGVLIFVHVKCDGGLCLVEVRQ